MYEHEELDPQKLYIRKEIEKQILIRSPYLLGKKVLNFNRYCKNHKDWDNWVRTNVDLKGNSPGKYLILQPRECFKTTFFSVNLIISFLLNNPDDAILIVSSNNANATAILRQIKNVFERNERFRYLFGDWVNKDNWNQNEIIINPRTNHDQKEASVTAVGKGNQLTSRHYKRIIFDDVVTSDDRDSRACRDDTRRYFMDCWDILDKQVGQLFVVGTRWCIDDLFSDIFEINKKLKENSFKSLITPAVAEDGTLNFPTILTKEKLDELRILKVGKDALDNASFESQYMLRPIASGDQIFKKFNYYNANETKYDVFILYCDPAISDKTKSCYSAIVLIGHICEGIHKGKWGVHATSIEKRPPTKLMQDMINLHRATREMFNLDIATYMETNGFQALMKDNVMRIAMEQGYELPITSRTETLNKEMRIGSLEPYITQAFLLFRDDWETASGNYKLLLQQLKDFPQGEKDAPDALCGAHLVSRGRYFNTVLEEEHAEVQQ